MHLHQRIRRFLAALLSVAIVLGLMPATMETASAATTTVKVVQIAAAQNNSIALKTDGTVIAWGDHVTGWAKPPAGLTDVVEIYAKDTTFLARKSNGTVVAWGSNNVGEMNIPNGLNNVISMAAAGSHTLAVSQSGAISGAGTVIAWGLNGNGQSTVPADAQAAVTKVAAGSYYSMALKFTGTVVDWGSNGADATSKPAGLSNVVDIDAGYLYALALKSDGTVVAWGKENNGNGILDVAGLTDVTAISANRTHALALKSDGTVVGWGDNTNGKATPPAGLTDVVAIAAGVNHSLALQRDGTVVSWGSQTSVPGDNELSSLTITEGAPSPAFSSSGTSYQYDIDPGTTSVHINAVLKDPAYSALYINDQLQTSGSTVVVPVPATGAVIRVRVEPYMGVPKTYTLTVSRDRVPPSVTFSPNGSETPLRTITTAVQVTDATSGIDASTLEYVWSQTASAPTGGWAGFSLLPYTQLAQFTYAGADGNWYLHIRAKDHAGNWTNAASEPFLIDNTPPVLSLTMKKETVDGEDYLEDTWSNTDVVITAAAADALSAAVTVKYTLDGGRTWPNYSGPITISDPGIQTVIVQASDVIGNVQTESRTVKITKGDLKLTVTKVSGGVDYSSGDWTNNSVRVTATAETKEGEIILPESFTWSMNGHDQGRYTPGHEIYFLNDGMDSGEFRVSDSLGNSLAAPYAVNIDWTAPTVSFTPNGNASPAREASVTATVADSGGSGLVESTLEYAWTQSTTEPTDGWLPLNNGSALTKEGVDGSWYLHIRGKDTAGNEVNDVSNPFVLDNSALNSTLSPATASFDKKLTAQTDVDTTMTLNGNTLAGISNGTEELISGTNYVITGNTVIIRKGYLATQPEGTTSLTFTFSGGDTQTLEITISNTTPSNSEISPDIASFDKNTSAQADVVTALALNGNTLSSISNEGTALVSGAEYTVDDDAVTIPKSYLAAQPLGITSLTFTFSAGAIQTLILMISDTTPSNSTPNIAIDYVNEQLTGFIAGGSYTINGTPVSPASGTLNVAGYMGSTINIVKKETGTTTADSAAQSLIVPARPATPAATGVDPATIGGGGTITGVTAAMEYKSSTGAWTDVTGTEIAGLTAGTYYIRVKATATSFKSAEQTVALTDPVPVAYTATINNGGVGASGSGGYTSGATVSIRAGTRSGYSFNGWTSSDAVTFADAASASTSFTMPAHNVTVTANWRENGGATGSRGGLSSPPALSIDKGGVDLDPASIDLTKPSVTLETAPKDGVAYVSIPASILASFEGKNATFFIEIKSPYGSYQVPVNLASLIVGLQDLLASNDLKAEDISFKVTLTDKSGDKDIQAAFEEGLPYGSAMGTIVDFSIQVVNAKTNEVIGTAEHFSKALTRVIPMPKNVTGMPEQWGAFRYDETTRKFGFVPAKIVQIDHVWYVMVSSYTNSVYVVAHNPVTFSDVQKHWSESAVELAAAKGLVYGVGGGKYEPNRTVTRAEFAVMLVRALGYGQQTSGGLSYDDVKPDAWYYDAVTEAKALGLLSFAGGKSFRPDQPLTREEMASMLAAVVTLEKLPMPQQQLDLNGYTDIRSVNAAYMEDVRIMVQLSIMTGTGVDQFSPKGETTRAQAAVVFIRTLQALGWMDAN